jgi:tetratricopeptide (TPR) repeat protein
MSRSDPDYKEGERLHSLGHYAEAEACFLRADAKPKARNSTTGNHAQVLLALARTQWKQGKLAEARKNAESARDLLAARKKATSGMAACLELLGCIRDDGGEAEQARSLFRESLAMQEQVQPVEPNILIQRYRRLAKAVRAVDEQEAEDLLKKAVEAAEKYVGTHSAVTADCLLELGQLQVARGNKEAGIEAMERAVEIHREVNGHSSEEVARACHCLASCCHLIGDLERAVQYYEKALSIRERQVGGSGPEVAILMMGLADVRSLQGHDAPAVELLQQAVGKLTGSGDEHLAWALEGLGLTYSRVGRFEDAVDCYRKARVYWEQDPRTNQEMLVANASRLDEALRYVVPAAPSAHRVAAKPYRPQENPSRSRGSEVQTHMGMPAGNATEQWIGPGAVPGYGGGGVGTGGVGTGGVGTGGVGTGGVGTGLIAGMGNGVGSGAPSGGGGVMGGGIGQPGGGYPQRGAVPNASGGSHAGTRRHGSSYETGDGSSEPMVLVRMAPIGSAVPGSGGGGSPGPGFVSSEVSGGAASLGPELVLTEGSGGDVSSGPELVLVGAPDGATSCGPALILTGASGGGGLDGPAVAFSGGGGPQPMRVVAPGSHGQFPAGEQPGVAGAEGGFQGVVQMLSSQPLSTQPQGFTQVAVLVDGAQGPMFASEAENRRLTGWDELAFDFLETC